VFICSTVRSYILQINPCILELIFQGSSVNGYSFTLIKDDLITFIELSIFRFVRHWCD